jgi:hypothetical protein
MLAKTVAKKAVACYVGRYLHSAGFGDGAAMMTSGFWEISLIVAIAIAVIPAASAQHVMFDAPGLTGKKEAPPPPPRAQPSVWPRLDPGAVLCRTEDDLDRHAANMTARVSGGDTRAADCRIVPQPTGIQILSRQGLGRTQVKLSTPGDVTGWTDAWLPDKAPGAR